MYREVITANKVLEDTPVERQFFENVTKLVEEAVTKQKQVDELRAKQQLVAEKEAEEAIIKQTAAGDSIDFNELADLGDGIVGSDAEEMPDMGSGDDGEHPDESVNGAGEVEGEGGSSES